MMHSTVLMVLAFLFLFEDALAKPDVVNQTGCHNNDVILNCSDFSEAYSNVTIRWIVQRQKIASMTNGKIRLFTNKSKFKERLTLNPNGSLKITSLKVEDESNYICVVHIRAGRSLNVRVTQLQVKCNGQFSNISHEVCTEEEVLLDCPAKHRTDPRNFKELKWHKKNNGSAWSLVAGLNESSARVVNDQLQLHGNGSLLLPRGRDVGKEIYKCDVYKLDGRRRERHEVHVKNLRCRSIGGNIKTTKSRVAMTTATPLKGTDVVMETTTAAASVVGPTTEVRTPITKAQFEVPSTQSTMVCGGVLRDSVGTFQSPNFPSPYPANSHCKWTISVPQDYTAINITLDRVSLEHEDDCQHDYIAVYDELENQIGCRCCGSHKSPIEVQVRGRTATVVFHSDSSVNKSGFKASYKSASRVENSYP